MDLGIDGFRDLGTDLEIVQSVSGNFNVLLNNSCEKREYIGSKTRNYARNVSDDGYMFQETKLLLYFRIENHG